MRILVIEDEEKLAKALKKGLKKDGYTVDCVTDGAEGQKRIELYSEDYDLIILDLMLPKKSGESVCRNVRKKGITTPILVLSAKGMLDDKVSLLDMGADDYLVKPFSFDELNARIRALLRRPEDFLGEELVARDLKLNINTRRVFKGDKEIHLTLKEFVLLEYLMRSKGRVLSREQIFNHLWDFANESFSNVIDVHIKNLRKKLHNGNKNSQLLETARGVGYKIKE